MSGLLINQWRERIGVMFGDPRTTPGGKGKNYTFLTRVEVAREEWLRNGQAQGRPGDQGPHDQEQDGPTPADGDGALLLSMTTRTTPRAATTRCTRFTPSPSDEDIIEQNGAWYTFGGQKWQGEKQVLAASQC